MEYFRKKKIKKLLKQGDDIDNILQITKKVIEIRENKQLNNKKLLKFLAKQKKKHNKILTKLKGQE